MEMELAIVASLISLAMGQIPPEKSCTKYFQYVNSSLGLQGEITLPTLKQGHNRIDLVFSQMGDQDDTSVGQLKPYPDEKGTQLSTGPYKFRIALKHSPTHGLPKLGLLSYNDQPLCSSDEYVLYVTYYTRSYEFLKNESLDSSRSSPIVCGRQGNIAPHFVQGKKFPLGRYPWLSAIYDKESGALLFKCVGTLISASVVISAAHCVYQKQENSVVIGLGLHDLNNFPEVGTELRNVKRLHSHPEVTTILNSKVDIALITMERPVTFNNIIAPICLWSAEASRTVSTAGVLAGWKIHRDSSEKQYPWVIEVEIFNATDCIRANPSLSDLVKEESLCSVNSEGSGPCFGGGLMVHQGDRWLLRGIASSGEFKVDHTCNRHQYCDLSHHIDWINDNIT
ncbi:serine protease gd-like [Drosophila takahashii]|uniref:serine protease gd-like n=1 Tax=Drosophila takahashii TaxID=29030 RepID=UPI00389943B6